MPTRSVWRWKLYGMLLPSATHGIPELLVSDNGSVFTSAEFKDFVKTQGIRHTSSAPYHPSTNGLAVQTFKAYTKKAPLRDNLSQFLFQYRMTPHSISPSELLLNRRPRSKLDLAIPNLAQKVRAKDWSWSACCGSEIRNPGALPPHRTYVPLVHGVTLSTSIYLCAWHGSDIRSTYVTDLHILSYTPTVSNNLPMRGNTFTDFTIQWASDSQWTGPKI